MSMNPTAFFALVMLNALAAAAVGQGVYYLVRSRYLAFGAWLLIIVWFSLLLRLVELAEKAAA